MTIPTLFFADLCPDTPAFMAELARLNIGYEAIEIMSSMANFKRFLRLRDQHVAFDLPKQNGYIGIPALLWQDKICLNVDELALLFG